MTTRPHLKAAWARDGDKPAPDTVLHERGWLHGEKPEHGHENWLQHMEDWWYLNTGSSGIPARDTDITYQEGAIVAHKTAPDYYIAQSTNKNVPLTDTTVWKKSIGGASLEYASEQMTSVHDQTEAHENNESNPHRVDTNDVGTYNKPTSDSKVKVVQDDVNQHEADRSDPHHVTATQINCLDAVVGGKFTGNVRLGNAVNKLKTAEMREENLTAKGMTIGFNSTGPHYEYAPLLTDLNYLSQRNKVEPAYAVPPPDLYLPLKSTIDCKLGTTNVISHNVPKFLDGHMFFEAGTGASISFSGSDCIGLETTIVFDVEDLPSGEGYDLLHIQIGDIAFDYKENNLDVIDSGHTVTVDHAAKGRIAYVRTEDRGTLYIDGVKRAFDLSASRDITTTDCVIHGNGLIRELKVWSQALTNTQVTLA